MRVTFTTSVAATLEQQHRSGRSFPASPGTSGRKGGRHQAPKPHSVPRPRPLPKPGTNR